MVSIIVPVYNASAYLKDCINSVVSQSFKKWELLLIDDGSNDDSFSICQRMAEKDSRIKVIKKSNGGAASARNVGINNAVGDFIIFLDSDDSLLPYTVEELLKIQKEYDSDIVSGQLISMKTRKKRWDDAHVFTNEVSVYDAADAISKMFFREIDFSQCAKIYKRKTIGDLRFSEGRTNEDTLFLFNFYKRCKKIVYIDVGLYLYRENPNSISHSYNDHYYDIYYNMGIMENETYKFSEKVKIAFAEYKTKVCIDFCFRSLQNKVWKKHENECLNARKYCLSRLGEIVNNPNYSYKYVIKLARVWLKI